MGGETGASILNVGWDQAREGMAGDSGEMFSAIKGAIMSFSLSPGPIARARCARQLPCPRMDSHQVGSPRAGQVARTGRS